MSELTELLASRRAFMVGAASLFAAPKYFASKLPLLWGDGEHDDTEAFQALFSGKPIRTAGTGDTFRPLYHDGWAALRGGKYLITENIRVTVPMYLTRAELFMTGGAFEFAAVGQPAIITHNHFHVDPDDRADAMVWQDPHLFEHLLSNVA